MAGMLSSSAIAPEGMDGGQMTIPCVRVLVYQYYPAPSVPSVVNSPSTGSLLLWNFPLAVQGVWLANWM
jgi:hypothetical protein